MMARKQYSNCGLCSILLDCLTSETSLDCHIAAGRRGPVLLKEISTVRSAENLIVDIYLLGCGWAQSQVG